MVDSRNNLLFSNDDPGTYPASWYAATAPVQPMRPQLNGEQHCDVVVIGAGFTGLSAALKLIASGYKVIVIDAHRVGWGASGRNGGQLGSGQRVDQDQLETSYGDENAARLWQLSEDSKALVRQLIKTYQIDCDFCPGIIDTDHKARFSQSTRAYVEKLQKVYGYKDIDYLEGKELSDLLGTDCYVSAAIDRGAGHLHPLKFVLGLARAFEAYGGVIYESSVVESVTSKNQIEIRTVSGSVKAGRLVFACNGYLGNLQSEVASAVMPINNYIIATAPLSDAQYNSILPNNMAVADSRFVVNYFRKSADKRLLFGGRESYGYRFPEDIKGFVRKAMVKVYPQLDTVDIEYGWGGTLAITMNRMPHVCMLSTNVYSASGYSGHGVGMATLCGHLIADAIDGDNKRFTTMAGIRHRKFPGGVALRSPLMKLGMLYYSLRDRL